MAEYQGISFSMKSSSPTSMEADVVAFDQCAAFGLPEATVMLKSHRSGMRVLVPADIFGLLQHCVYYQTIAEHVDFLVTVDPAIAPHKDQIQQVLKDLKTQGLMDSGERLIGSLKSAKRTAAQPAGFAGTYIRTCDRPAQLKRLLESLCLNQERYGHQHRYIVVDDSRNAENLQQNQAICAEYITTGRLSTEYYGLQQQSEYVKQLTQAFPEHKKTIHWLLARDDRFDESMFTGGRLLNHIILLAAGQRFALFDDDAACQPYQSPQCEHVWSFKAQPKDAWFYQNREQMLAEIQPLELDPLSLHLDILGQSLGEIVNELSAVELTASALHGVRSDNSQTLKPDTRILVTRNGTFGDPGTSSMTWVYQQDNKVLERLVEDDNKYKQYTLNRTTWLGSHTFRAVNENALMTTTLTGIDGSQLIPPTGSFYRNEDYLFSRLLKFIHPHSLSFEFPWGLPHLPEPSRQWDAERLDEPKTVGILGFLADIANNVQRFCLAESPQQRLRYVGETYRSLADAKREVLNQGIEENLLNAQVATVNDMQIIIDNNKNQPQFWKDDIKRVIKANKDGLARSEQTLFPDVGAGDTRDQQVQSCQDVLDEFGDALILWPELWEYCKQLNQV
ncbi:MAG TPA: hypothetical protein ENJ32_03295 [Crenotrichaceae bacterium]|nr:hypothetical protein [Crenotrichaceae bacterium]